MTTMKLSSEDAALLTELHKQDVYEGGDGTRYVDYANQLIKQAGYPPPTVGPIRLSMSISDGLYELEWS